MIVKDLVRRCQGTGALGTSAPVTHRLSYVNPDHWTCPICGAEQTSVFAPAARVELETRARERFIFSRLSSHPSPGQLKDLTDFAHNPASPLRICENCGLLVRDEAEADYQEEAYDRGAIERVYPRYVAAFRIKEGQYRHLLPPGAEVLEVGSHFGAFLQVAREWGWNATGVDIGRDTTEFATSLGHRVLKCTLAECGFPEQAFDGVCVWNCFEQIPDEAALLGEIRRILKNGGLLVLRTPNAAFYRQRAEMLQGAQAEKALKAMAYNNLLAFPYLYGHTRQTLHQLVSRFGFQPVESIASELLTFPLPEVPRWVEAERRQVSASVLGGGEGAWIEVSYRKAPAAHG